jgi:hypothetical protein
MTSRSDSAPIVYTGVDTHADTHHVAVVSEHGKELADREFPTTANGYSARPCAPRRDRPSIGVSDDPRSPTGRGSSQWTETVLLSRRRTDHPSRKPVGEALRRGRPGCAARTPAGARPTASHRLRSGEPRRTEHWKNTDRS